MRPLFAPWQPAPDRPLCLPEEVHLWRARLAEFACDEHLLAADEQARAARLRLPDKARQYAVGRALLRTVLARYLACTPAALTFGYGPHGKPFLADHPQLQFNLAHSGAHWLLAVRGAVAVGVDVEQVDPALDWRGLAQRYLPAAEFTGLLALPATRQRRTFYRLWTRREALYKGIGTGLGAAPPSVPESWQVFSLGAARHACAALATVLPLSAVRRFDLSAAWLER